MSNCWEKNIPNTNIAKLANNRSLYYLRIFQKTIFKDNGMRKFANKFRRARNLNKFKNSLIL